MRRFCLSGEFVSRRAFSSRDGIYASLKRPVKPYVTPASPIVVLGKRGSLSDTYPDARFFPAHSYAIDSSFQRKLESSVFHAYKSLDPSFRWDDERFSYLAKRAEAYR